MSEEITGSATTCPKCGMAVIGGCVHQCYSQTISCGWTCPTCHCWVANGTYHLCGNNFPGQWITPSPRAPHKCPVCDGRDCGWPQPNDFLGSNIVVPNPRTAFKLTGDSF